MKTKYIFILFILVALVQLAIPAQMIFGQETVLKTGVAYKFKTRPVDPSDPFKGKYITLNFDVSNFKTKDSLWERNEEVLVYLTTDSLGYAKIDAVSKHVLERNTNDYVKAKAYWYSTYSKELVIRFPFNKYYMKETKAYAAETAVRDRQRDSLPNNTHALVYVQEGEAVLEDVIIDDISIKDYVEKK
ncbi:GDYXXLXY domain-containing protein [Algibacter sp. L1A34]|uniref:GDYXXLXY domain-containing protein n=1 Tax=Algibacter sp. L1A34 TaxID=2686365 RepID=UPI00131D32E1|nr:GDYXXLXY domain-containing protein [Algibacter sp. L1A34]